MPKALWKQTLEASKSEALLAVDLYNEPAKARRLEGFYIHMHLAWLYLLHARFRRDGIDFRYRLANGRFDRVDGEPKTWDLKACVRRRWPDPADPIRNNLEFTIALRNKIEHRYQDAIGLATAGQAQACLLNYEEELTAAFGVDWSLAESLRFPLFVGTFTQDGASALSRLQKSAPRRVRNFISTFTAGLSPDVAQSPRFDFRLNLIPKKVAKTEADLALSFVRLEDLSDEEREKVVRLGQSGKAVIVEKKRPVQHLGRYRPSDVVRLVDAEVDRPFRMADFIAAWKTLGVRPPTGSNEPQKTDEKYCVYDDVHRDYVYTDAYVRKLIKECSTQKGFLRLMGVADG